jgi:hypothetical protein
MARHDRSEWPGVRLRHHMWGWEGRGGSLGEVGAWAPALVARASCDGNAPEYVS